MLIYIKNNLCDLFYLFIHLLIAIFFRVWDTRSCRTPLYDLQGHTDKILASHWRPGHIVSGGADNQLKFYKMAADLK